jgi:APA family basic amino acid/polyamine antiporter
MPAPDSNLKERPKSEPSGNISNNLRPSLGVFTTTMLVVGGVIGSGIFRKPGVMAAELGSPTVLLSVWVVAGIITMFGALTNAEISSMIPETGGQYVFFQRMYGQFFAWLYGWSVFAVIQTGSIAALAYVFAEYSTRFDTLHFLGNPEMAGSVAAFSFHLPFIGDVMPLREVGVKGLAVFVIFLLTFINYVGVRFGGWVQNIFTVAKLVGMAALFFAAFTPASGGSISHLTTPSATIHKEGLALVVALAAALQGAFWAYDGWVKISFVAGEVRNPQHIIPKATVYGMLIVTAVYLSLNLAYCWVLPVDIMAKSKLVAADVAEKISSGGGKWIALVVMCSTFSANNGTILASARVYFAMARRNLFPAIVGRAHPRFDTPAGSLVIQAIWSSALVFTGTFDMLTDTLIFVSWLYYAAGAFGIFVLRKKMPDVPRPFKVPAYPWIPAIFVIFATIFLVLTAYNDLSSFMAAKAAGKPALINCAFGVALVLLGTPVYLLYRRKS